MSTKTGQLQAGAIAYGAAQASGAVGGANLNFAAEVIAYGVIGGATSAASGGDFRDGFYAGAVTAAFSPAIGGIKGNTVSASVARITVAAVIGGTASELSGGKFANGAQIAAFLQAVTEASVYYEHRMGGKAGHFVFTVTMVFKITAIAQGQTVYHLAWSAM